MFGVYFEEFDLFHIRSGSVVTCYAYVRLDTIQCQLQFGTDDGACEHLWTTEDALDGQPEMDPALPVIGSAILAGCVSRGVWHGFEF